MAENLPIEWTHHTFNPWIGCTKVSAACDFCYAEAWDAQGLLKMPSRWGPLAARTTVDDLVALFNQVDVEDGGHYQSQEYQQALRAEAAKALTTS